MADEKTRTWKEWLSDIGLEQFKGLPDAVLDRDWKPEVSDRNAAWNLFVEMRTRISTRHLHFQTGTEAAALASLHKLFLTTRELLKGDGIERHHFSVFAVVLLEDELSPFTSKWHGLLERGAFDADDARREFRGELLGLQKQMHIYLKCFCALAMDDRYFAGAEAVSVNEKNDKSTGHTTNGAIPFDRILFFPSNARHADILAAEQEEIRARRGLEGGQDINDLVGISCSGGGIRSATFCLGVFQGLAKARFKDRSNVLQSVDYLSTVSGGGYLGAFLSCYLNDDDKTVGLKPDQLPLNKGDDPEDPAIRSIRNNMKYLLKGGSPGQARAVGLFLLGMMINFICLAPLVAGVVIGAGLLSGGTYDHLIGNLIATLMIVVVVSSLLRPIVLMSLCPVSVRKFCNGIAIWAGLAAVFSTIAYCVVWLLIQVLDAVGDWVALAAMAGAAVAFVVAALLAGLNTVVGRVSLAMFGLAGPALLALMTAILARRIGCLGDDTATWSTCSGDESLKWFIVAFALLAPLIYGALINVNLVTPFQYYRNRLSETFMIRRTQGSDGVPLSGLRSNNKSGPYHLINATVNVPASRHEQLRGRLSDFFLFSRHYCGSPVTGYCKTETLEKSDPALDLGTAMSISGAAASPFMGTLPFGTYRFWLALFNVRLGYWVPNPGRLKDRKPYRLGPSLLYILREFTGQLTDSSRYVNVSDGGHIENTGVYELLRRRCKFIILIDAEADPGVKCGALYKVMRYAKIDFDVDIKIDTSAVELGPAGNSGAHFTVGRIRYDANHSGVLVYVKLSVTGNEVGYLADYRLNNPSFPFESTADQFFSEAQFESYRALGSHVANDLFREEVLNTSKSATVNEWFEALADSHDPAKARLVQTGV